MRSVGGHDGMRVVLAGPWTACTPCHQLIQADKWAELGERSLRLFRAAYGPLAAAADIAVAADLGPTWMAFQRHRTGPARRIAGAM
ncbi:hypothetical protein ACWD1Y_23760 [Streptomyces sp. NPDC002814]